MEPTILLLLVEDEGVIQMLLEDAPTKEGFELVVAANGKEALADLDADAARFRGLVRDVDLCHGPDCWDVARHARELVPEMPVVYMSGASGHERASKGVPKPFVPAQIITAVTTLLNETGSH